MKNLSTLSLFIGIISILFLPINSYAQSNKLSSYLDEKENKKIESSQKLINKGNSIVSKSNEYEKEVETLKNADGRIKTGKIKKLNKKIAANKMKAAVYYEDGYTKQIKTLDSRLKDIEKTGNSEAETTRNDVKTLQKKAKKQYNKAERLSSPDEMIKLIELAQENQIKAIEIQETSLLKLMGDVAITEEPVNEVIPQDSITQDIAEQNQAPVKLETDLIPNTTPPVVDPSAVAIAAGVGVGTTAAILPEREEISEPEIEEVPVESPAIDSPVFLSIQFLADKEKANTEKLNKAYNGSLEIIEMQGDGWFRYSAGKFTDVETARNTMKSEGIKGFIVAYNNQQRIPVKKAMELLKQ